MTYGQKAVGLKFNPSKDNEVNVCKSRFADLIDRHNDARSMDGVSREQARLYSIAITQLQQAEMWSVKALTWKYSKEIPEDKEV